jgi:hypothetical protein
VGPHPKRKIITLPRATVVTIDQKPIGGPQTVAGVVRVGENHKASHAGPHAFGTSPIAAFAAWKLKRAQALAWLAATYPAVFSADVKPLALGTGRLVWPEAKVAAINRAAFNAAMKFRTTSPRYLDALTAPGAMRFDLAGNAVESVSLEYRERATAMLVEIKLRITTNRLKVERVSAAKASES